MSARHLSIALGVSVIALRVLPSPQWGDSVELSRPAVQIGKGWTCAMPSLLSPAGEPLDNPPSEDSAPPQQRAR